MNQFVNILRSSEIFFQFTLTQLEMVSAISKEKTFALGESIFEENAKSKDLYVIASGEVGIFFMSKEKQSGYQLITTLCKGQSFGEMALVDEGHRSASVRAKDGNVRLLEIPRDKLLMLCETYPHLGFRLMSNLAANLAMMVRNADRAAITQFIPESGKKQLIQLATKKNKKAAGLIKRSDNSAQINNYNKKLKIVLSKLVNDILVNPDNY